jgi:hypothetical protein
MNEFTFDADAVEDIVAVYARRIGDLKGVKDDYRKVALRALCSYRKWFKEHGDIFAPCRQGFESEVDLPDPYALGCATSGNCCFINSALQVLDTIPVAAAARQKLMRLRHTKFTPDWLAQEMIRKQGMSSLRQDDSTDALPKLLQLLDNTMKAEYAVEGTMRCMDVGCKVLAEKMQCPTRNSSRVDELIQLSYSAAKAHPTDVNEMIRVSLVENILTGDKNSTTVQVILRKHLLVCASGVASYAPQASPNAPQASPPSLPPFPDAIQLFGMEYTLRAVTYKSGPAEGGHWVTVTSRVRDNDSLRWFLCDDDSIQPAHSSQYDNPRFRHISALYVRKGDSTLENQLGIVLRRPQLMQLPSA